MAILSSYSVLGEATALNATAANDIVLNDHTLSITSCPSMDFRKIISTNGGWLAPVAATLGVIYVKNSATASRTYTFLLQQDIPGQGTVSMNVSYTSLSSTTAGTITAALTAAISANPQFKVTLTKSTVTNTDDNLIITAKTGYPAIRVTNLSPVPTDLTVTVNTPYVISRGAYQDLINAGVAASAIATGHTYYQIQFVFVDNSAGDWMQNQTVRIHTLYVYSSATNFSGFSTLIANAIQGLNGSTGTFANPEILSVNS
jgi:hypothetical protein